MRADRGASGGETDRDITARQIALDDGGLPVHVEVVATVEAATILTYATVPTPIRLAP